ncbi:MAG TPA: hypothetical protein VHV55_04510 [Pirellulales bacterium]|jgi:hypothetical protein|nr:hypothetical protein [Pirellulales bacterium]
MRRIGTLGVVMATGFAMLAYVGGPRLPQAAGHEGPDEPNKPRAAVTQLEHATQLDLTLGIKDKEQKPWEGKLSISEGRIVSVKIVLASNNSTVEGEKFMVRAKRRQGGGRQANQNRNPNRPQRVPLDPAKLRLVVDAPESATVRVETSRGDFSFRLADLETDSTKMFLDGEASVVRQAAATRLTGRETEDDFPSMAKSANGDVWVSYVAYKPGPPLNVERVQSVGFDALVPKGNGDQILLMRFDGKQWHAALAVTPPGRDVWRPKIAMVGNEIGIAWAEPVDGDWEIMSRRYDPAKDRWSPVTRVTDAPGTDFSVVSAVDSKGQWWIAWQAYRKDNYDILLAKARPDGSWDKPRTVSTSSSDDWSPAIAADSKGRVYVAWDTYDAGNFDVMLHATDETGQPQVRQWPVATSARFEARSALVCDSQDRVWIAYEEGNEQWGKDFASEKDFRKSGLAKNPGYALYIDRIVKVKCLDDGQIKRPAAALEQAIEKVLTRNKSVPQMTLDSAGGLWLFLRHHPGPNGQGETWHSYAVRYNGKNWEAPVHLADSSNLIDNRPASVALDGGLITAHSSDDRTRTQDRDQSDLFTLRLASKADVVPPAIMADEPPPPAELATVHPNEPEDIARMRAYRLTVGGKELRLLRGEFHRHTEFSSHRDGDGLLEDSWRYAQDAARHDWMGNGDHLNGFGHEYLWWINQKMADVHNHAPTFVSAMSYERSQQFPNGHRNVIMPRRGIRPLPTGDLKGTPDDGTPDTKMLYACLKHFGGMCASHTSATEMGTDWRDNDTDVEPVVEIYQGHRHNYETFGAPRSPTEQTQIGGYRPQGFIWNALEKGYRLGFQSSSDHVSTHLSYAIVLAPSASRQSIIDAFKARHCYAATDNILLVVRSGEHLMGDRFETAEKPTLSIEAHGTAPIARLHIVKNNKYVYSVDLDQPEVRRSWTDMDIQAGDAAYYYVRIEQADGNLAWASPCWVSYRP